MATEEAGPGVFAPAKINLTLHVTGRRADGYHLLDSLVVFADLGDRLWFAPGPERMISVTGPFAGGVPTDARNLVWQAAELAGWTGHIRLEKNLPHGAGIGGGSADAAAVLRHLGFTGDGLSLGADVPVCVQGRATRMQGVGEVLSSVDVPAMQAVLVNPGVEVPTPAVFRALENRDNPPMGWPCEGPFMGWLAAQRNDLEAPAMAVAPVIGDVLDVLGAQTGCKLARMSGSGATCFGLFSNRADAEAAASKIAAQHPEWWVAPCRLS